jgi:hypothetical protein
MRLTEKTFKRRINQVNRKIERCNISLHNSYELMSYTDSELENKTKDELCRMIRFRYLHSKRYKEIIIKVRYDLKILYRELRRLMIENYQLNQCKNRKGMKKKMSVYSFKYIKGL